MAKVEYGKDCSIDVDSCTVIGIDLGADDCDYTCVVVIRKVGEKFEVLDTYHQQGNDAGKMLEEMMAKYSLKIEDEDGGWNVFRT